MWLPSAESWDNMRAMIGTWRMCLDGLTEGYALLNNGGSVDEAVEHAVMRVEDEPSFTSVGYGGLPALDGRVLLDGKSAQSRACSAAVVRTRDQLSPGRARR